MCDISSIPKISPNHERPQNCRTNAEPDVVGYLKCSISDVMKHSSVDSAIQKSENGAENLIGEDCKPDKDVSKNGSNSAGIGCLFKGGVGSGLSVTEKEQLKVYLKDTAQLMTRELDEVTEQVLQVCRMRTSLKRKRSRTAMSSENKDRGKASKKQRMLFLARSEAAYRRRMTDVFRECGSILKQIMQHKWCWPFIQPIDVGGLGLSNYYDVIKMPMNLKSVQDRIEAEDSSGYSTVREICEDVRLVFRNAMAYNPSGTDVHKFAKVLLEKFEEKWRSVLEPQLIGLEAIREEEQGYSDIGGLVSEISSKKYSDEVFQKLSNIEKNLEEFLRATTSKCRPMSMMEKEELVRRIRHLHPIGLNRVIQIIAQEKTSLDVSAEEIPVDLNKADPATLWRLYFYCEVASPSISVDNG